MPRKIVFVLVLAIILSACTPALTPTPSPVLGRGTPEGQGVGLPATSTPDPTVTSPPSATPESPTPTPTAPEPLLPLDFAVKDWSEFFDKIQPYCYARADLQGGAGGVKALSVELKQLPIYETLMTRQNNGEIYSFGITVTPDNGGTRCAVFSLNRRENGLSVIVGGLFQSRLDPSRWIEIWFTEPK